MKKTMDLVKEVAQGHERVIDDPSPIVWFTEFGEDALEIVLHCFIRNPHVRASTASELRLSINEKFNDAGIRVAYSQRDVHLDTGQPLDVRINRDAAPPRDT